MTVSSAINRNDYIQAGGLATFSYTFKIYYASDLKVYVNGVLKTLIDHYTLTGIGNEDGGNVVFNIGNIPPLNTSIILIRDLPILQGVDYKEGDKFPAETHENILDRLTMIAQQIVETLGRTFKVATTSVLKNIILPEGANKFLKWNVAGNGIEVVTLTPPEGFEDHSARHQDTGADEISVTGLSGLLADDQHVLDAEVLAVAEDKTKKGGENGYASLDSTTKVPIAQIASGTPDGTKFVRDDRTLVTPAITPTGSQGDMLYKGSSDWLAGKMWVNAKSYGAVGDGSTDDRTAILNATTSLGVTGGTVLLPPPGKYLIDTALTLPANVTLKGPFSFVGATNATSYGNMSALIINSAVTVTLGAGSGIEGCLVYRKGISFPVANAAAFAGTAITFGGDDCFVFNSMILGFNKLIYSTGHQRPHIWNVQGDGVNGIEIINCTDIGRCQSVHLWPFAIYPGEGTYIRAGTAFKFSSVGDWNKATDCFDWGYKYGFNVASCNSMTLLSCGADNPSGENTDSIGFAIAGTSDDTRLIGCQSAGHYNSAYHIGTSAGKNTRLIGCDAWGITEHAILIDSGDVSITGGNLRNTPSGITINNTVSKILIDQVENLCTVPITYAQANPYVVKGFVDIGDGGGWAWYGGEGGGTLGQNYVHTQTNANTTWTVTHNLGYKEVIVQAFDTSYNEIIPLSIVLNSTSQCTITFSVAQAGYGVASSGGGQQGPQGEEGPPGTTSDTAYGSSWDGVTTVAPSKNAVYDEMELKAPIASPTFTGTVGGITATMVSLGNVDNTSNATERAATATLTNKRITPRITTITSHATPTINTDNCDAVTITAQAETITSMTTNLSGTPTNFQKLIIRIKDNGTGYAITWGASFVAKGVALPTTTVSSKLLTVGFIYDTVAATWGCVAVANEA